MPDAAAASVALQVPVDDRRWDVMVAGGGPAGCAAALAAAREGAAVLLVESTTALGGMGTSGLVPCWAPFSDGTRYVYGGIARRVLRESTDIELPPEEQVAWIRIHAERLKRVYDRLLADGGVSVLFGSAVVDLVQGADRAIEAVVVGSKGGLTAHAARAVVDATGDADVAARAGVPFAQGDETGEMQPATLCFILSGVDEEALAGDRWPALGKALWEDEALPAIQSRQCRGTRVGPGLYVMNAGHVWEADPADTAQFGSVLRGARELVADIHGGLMRHAPDAFGASSLVATAPLLGLRETRRIEGEYVLTVEDHRQCRTFEDRIGRNCYAMDIHCSRQSSRASGVMDEPVVYEPGQSHTIPYRCLYSPAVPNLLVAGRAISCERPVQGSIRIMPACLVTGEAAGVAAALAGRSGGQVAGVDVAAIQGALRNSGAVLD